MVQRPRLMTASALFLLLPSVTLAQGVTIQHEPIGCVVAGKFPKISSCFAPAASVARARVYFKAETGQHWYWVEFPSGVPCPTAILPKPTRQIAKMAYYVGAMDREFREARTPDRLVDVVADEASCAKDLLVAPWVDTASVSAGAAAGAPAVPAGFAATGSVGGGIGTGFIIGGLAGVGVGAAVIVAAGGDDTLDLTGRWVGTGSDSVGSSTVTWDITQSGQNISGSMTFTDLSNTTTGRGTVSGMLSGTALSYTMAIPRGGIPPPFDFCTITVNGSGPVTSTTIDGTFAGQHCVGPVTNGRLSLRRQ